MQKVGFVGLGNMGAPMVRSLIKKRFDVIGYDVSADRREAVSRIEHAATTGDLADLSGCDLVILMLPNGRIVRDVLIGPDGLGLRLRPGALVIDMSSSDPAEYDGLADRLSKRGVAFVDAPVSGNVSGAEAGTLTIIAGGRLADVEAARPVLEAIGQRVFHMGSLGAGQTMKALNNMLSAGGLILAIETLLIAKRAGLDPKQVNEVLNLSTGRNNSTERKIEPFVLSRRFDSGFSLALMAKDLRTAQAIAARVGADLPLSRETCRNVSDAAVEAEAAADHTGIALWLEKLAGIAL